MGFTDEQLNEVDAALVTKVIGKRKTRVAYGDKAIDYSDVDFDKADKFRDKIARDTCTTPRFFLMGACSKGL